MDVSHIMQGNVKSMPQTETFAEAARMLRDNRISSLVVTNEGAPVGIVTERDFVNLIAEAKDPSSTPLGARMTGDVATVHPSADLQQAAQLMVRRQVRHLPVVEGGLLVGMVSARDLIGWMAGQSSDTPGRWLDWLDLVEDSAVAWPH